MRRPFVRIPLLGDAMGRERGERLDVAPRLSTLLPAIASTCQTGMSFAFYWHYETLSGGDGAPCAQRAYTFPGSLVGKIDSPLHF